MSETNTAPEPTTTPSSAELSLRPRRTLNRLALAGLGVAVGALAQFAFSQNSLWDGLLLYLVAALIFIRALSGVLPASRFELSPAGAARRLSTRPGWLGTIGLWLIAAAVGSSVLSYSFFGQVGAQIQAWWYYWGSLALLIVGGLLLSPDSPMVRSVRRLVPNRPTLIWLGVILLIAAVLRLFNFTGLPFGIWFDEAEAGLAARRILQDPGYRPVFYPLINVTGHFLTLYALALRWLGDNIYAMRLISALFGIGTVLVAYLFGRELHGPRFGLALAFFAAVARWLINFSRVAMTGIDTPFFEFLTLFFLVRLLKRGRLRDALWAGLTIGFGLMFYTAFRLFVAALLLFVLIAVLCWTRPIITHLRRIGWRKISGTVALTMISAWLVAMPLAHVALDNPSAFWYRTRQISIFTKRDQPNLSDALWDSTRQHLLMFNFRGDRNGRHNLPGEPMLDPLMAILFVLGLALALRRAGDPANLFFLLLFPLALVGGIFSVDFEAPQSLRSIAVLPAVLYFVALATAALGREAERVLSPLPRSWLVAPAAIGAIAILFFNAHTYFVRQANDFAVWNAFSAPETITGRQMAELGPGYSYYLSPFLTNHPTTKFLAPDIEAQNYLLLPDALPIRDSTGRPVALFIHPDDSVVYDEAQMLYPEAEFEIFSGPAEEDAPEGPPSVYFVALSPENLNAVRGLEVRYWSTEGDSETQFFTAPLASDRVPTVNVTWPEEPAPDNFYAEWNGVLYAPTYGSYGLRVEAPADVTLELDGTTLFEDAVQAAGHTAQVELAQGNHQIRLRAEAARGQVALYWQPPGQPETVIPEWALYAPPITNHGLRASYYPNPDWEGEPVLQRIDPYLDTYFHLIPLNRPYTVEWEGSLVAPQSGIYQLGLRAVQEATLSIDGQQVLTTIAPNQYSDIPLDLEAGLHDISIRFRDTVDRSRIHLTWIPPSGGLEPIPSSYLWPPMGTPPALPEAPAQANLAPITLRHLITIGSPGSEAGQFLEPHDITSFQDGRIAVADTGNRRVQLFSPQYQIEQTITGNGQTDFQEPLAVAVNRQDQLFVLDSTLQWIYRYSPDGTFIDQFGGPTARLFHPRGLSIFDDGTIAVADTGSSQIKLFDPAGRLAGTLGALGPAPGQFNEPTDIYRDEQATYFVVEAENNRIQQLSGSGTPLNQWAIPGTEAATGPHLAAAPDDSLFVTDPSSASLKRYSPDGTLIDQWNAISPAVLSTPVGIYFDPANDRLYITDVATHQVHVFWVNIAERE